VRLLSVMKNDADYVSSIRKSVLGFDWSNIAQALIEEYIPVLTSHLVAVS